MAAKLNRVVRSSKAARRELFAPLESRQLMTIDLTGSTSMLTGFYAPGDHVDLKVSMKQSTGGGTQSNFPIMVTTYLSRDTKFGNSDDVKIGGGFFLVDAHAKTQTQSDSADLPDDLTAGGYYIVTQVDDSGLVKESNEHNNVSFSKKQDIRIVTDTLSTGEVDGTSKNDSIVVRQTSDHTIVTVNGKTGMFKTFDRTNLTINAGKGNDSIKTEAAGTALGINMIIDGGAGNDTIYGGSGNDQLTGGSGNDKLFGANGFDTLNGGSGNDYCEGGEGTDTIDGGAGTDSAKKDSQATFASIEKLIN